MAELEARYDVGRGAGTLLWRLELPPEREVSIGRNPLTLADVPPENRSEWVTDPRDTFVSGCHAFVRWDGERLYVRRRSHPRPPQNPVLYKKLPQHAFDIGPGESFSIGQHVFALHTGATAEPEATDPSEAQPTIYRMPVADSSSAAFADPTHILKALKELPDLIRYSRDASGGDDHLLDLVFKSLAAADVAAIVGTQEFGKEVRVVTKHMKDRRPPSLQVDEFRPSQRLVRRAIADIETILFVRGQQYDSRVPDATLQSAVDWAICAPLVKDRRLGLYVAGGLRVGFDPTGKTPPAELRDYQKVVDLAAQIYEAVHDLRQAEQQVTRYQRFLPPTVVTLLNSGTDPDELLKPRETAVTVLFCDLRGASRFAEAGGDDLVGNWQRISQALDMMTTAIIDEGGVIGNLQGDAAMGFWGWPFPQPDQVVQAARAALRIHRDFARAQAGGRGAFACGVGLAHGNAVAGRLGTFDQIKLDVFGPVVNRAARLESLTKDYGVPILMDEAVAAAAKAADTTSTTYQTRSMGTVCPAGMDHVTAITELAPRGSYADHQRAHWEAIVNAFTDGRWHQARAQLEKYRQRGGDKAADFLVGYMDRRDGKAPADWDGVVRFDHK